MPLYAVSWRFNQLQCCGKLLVLAERIGESGSATLLPWIQEEYILRVSAYSEGLKQFLVGYREGFAMNTSPDSPDGFEQSKTVAPNSKAGTQQ